jgi:hypothetical protein
MTPTSAWLCDPWGITSALLVLFCIVGACWALKKARR